MQVRLKKNHEEWQRRHTELQRYYKNIMVNEYRIFLKYRYDLDQANQQQAEQLEQYRSGYETQLF